jgi:AAA domain
VSAFERFLERLEGVTRRGDKATAQCPAHEDRRASLSVARGCDGRVLLNCFAGCSPEAVASAAGSSLADLYEPALAPVPPEPRSAPVRRMPLDPDAIAAFQEALLSDAATLERLLRLRGWTKEAIERLGLGLDHDLVVFPIRNAVGALVGVERYQPDPAARGTRPKVIAQAGSRRDLFPAPEEVESPEIVLTEGGSDAVRAWSLGVPAVSVPGVSGWQRGWAERFRGRSVCIVFDGDEQGRRAAVVVARDLEGVAEDVRVLDLDPTRTDGFDLSDYFAGAHTAEERRTAGDLLLDMARRAPHVSREAERGTSSPSLVVVTARELCAIPDPPVSDQLLGPLLIRAQRTVLGAHTGEGKTSMSLWMVRAVVDGAEFLGWPGRGGVRALYLDAEQGLRSAKRRLREVGLDECDAVDYVRVPDGLALDADPRHVAEVERLLAAGEYALVVADPLYKLHTGDSNAEREAVDLMRCFDAWREHFGFALILPSHLRKPVQGTKLSIHDVFGSSAYVRGAEVVLGLQRVRPGYARLHFLKDRDGDLPVGEHWGLLFDRGQGFVRDPDDGKRELTAVEQVRVLLEETPLRTKEQLVAATDRKLRTIEGALKALGAVSRRIDGSNGPNVYALPEMDEVSLDSHPPRSQLALGEEGGA